MIFAPSARHAPFARGTSDGLGLALNVAAMLITFTALVALVNFLLTWGFGKLHIAHGEVTLQKLLSYPMAPLGWLLVRDTPEKCGLLVDGGSLPQNLAAAPPPQWPPPPLAGLVRGALSPGRPRR